MLGVVKIIDFSCSYTTDVKPIEN